MEFTRLDSLIDVMFTAAKDVESSTEAEVKGHTKEDESPAAGESKDKSTFEFTDSEQLQGKRELIIASLGKREDASLIKKTRAMYWSPDHKVRAACSVSKRYAGTGVAKYWYAYHPSWDEFLAGAKAGYFVLGCMDLPIAFAIPHKVIHEVLDQLNTTVRQDPERIYWHIHIHEPQPGVYELSIPKAPYNLPLQPYVFDVT